MRVSAEADLTGGNTARQSFDGRFLVHRPVK
jgi:hypothetical protein